jgi:hypothetical protein
MLYPPLLHAVNWSVKDWGRSGDSEMFADYLVYFLARYLLWISSIIDRT